MDMEEEELPSVLEDIRENIDTFNSRSQAFEGIMGKLCDKIDVLNDVSLMRNPKVLVCSNCVKLMFCWWVQCLFLANAIYNGVCNLWASGAFRKAVPKSRVQSARI